MLSDRLKRKELFITDRDAESAHKALARRVLNDAVEALIMAMNAVERDKAYSREDIEEFVVKRIESYEKTLYEMDDDEFDEEFGRFVQYTHDETQRELDEEWR